VSEQERPAVLFLVAAHKRAAELAHQALNTALSADWTDTGDAVGAKDREEPIAVGPRGHMPDAVRQHIALHDPRAVLHRIAAE